MAPVRRYLRISKFSVLECRIYPDNPALAQSWLLSARDAVLPRVIESIRPLVLPKLREERERERSRRKGSKKKKVKDSIVQDDFEVSMFLTDTGTRHSLLTKRRRVAEAAAPPLRCNSGRLMGETNDWPIDADAAAGPRAPPRAEGSGDDDDGIRLADIPPAGSGPKRQRGNERSGQEGGDGCGDGTAGPAIELDSDADEPASKRRRGESEDEDEDEDKKKLATDVRYQGFALYGRVLCLVVKRRDAGGGGQAGRARAAGGRGAGAAAAGQGQARMENWITSTQIAVGEESREA